MDFPKYLASCYSHMTLIQGETNDVFYLVPPNQMDWHFTISKLKTDDHKWKVHAIREYHYGFSKPWEYVSLYEKCSISGVWTPKRFNSKN
jgi:hypothetical protein